MEPLHPRLYFRLLIRYPYSPPVRTRVDRLREGGHGGRRRRSKEREETCKLARAGIKAEGSPPGAHLKFRARAPKIRGCCAAWGEREREGIWNWAQVVRLRHAFFLSEPLTFSFSHKLKHSVTIERGKHYSGFKNSASLLEVLEWGQCAEECHPIKHFALLHAVWRALSLTHPIE